ncbi:MAG: sulfatase-like hydrolase/transferase, partial [Acidimicrobiia bacterium]
MSSLKQFIREIHRRSLWQVVAGLLVLSCAGCETGPAPLTVDMPLHLEEHLDAATIVGSELPADGPESMVWSFDEPQPGWRAFTQFDWRNTRQSTRTDDALRIVLTDADRHAEKSGGKPSAGVYTDFRGLERTEATHLLIRARTESAGWLSAVVDDTGPDRPDGRLAGLFQQTSDAVPMIADGSVQSYLLPIDVSQRFAWRRIGLMVGTDELGSVDILSVSVVSQSMAFAGDPLGVMTVVAGSEEHRRTLFTHTPGRVAFTVRVPRDGRLDVGLGVVQDDAPVDFSVTVTSRGRQEEASLLEETLADRAAWVQRSVDLSDYEGQTVTLALQAHGKTPGTVALWTAPTLSGSRVAGRPNVIFYIIDGAGAEYMSLYGYNRRTTPNLERLAAEGAVFERVYSNASWTLPSTPSFMTSLQNRVLGGRKTWGTALPENALTMAQHMHAGGYQTAVFTANPNAGTATGLQRGVDWFQEGWAEGSYYDGARTGWRESSKYMHEGFWSWREEYPGEPYWVHFQTVDIHNDFPEVAPFGGLFVSATELQTWRDWGERLRGAGGLPRRLRSPAWEETGISRVAYWTLKQGLYDEAMAYNDYQIGRLVERLKAEGEWENTLLIVAADHSIRNAVRADMGLAIQDSMPPGGWESPMFRPSVSRVPLLFVWPGHIEGGHRFSEPVVSMID